jgi:hypothetical protein
MLNKNKVGLVVGLFLAAMHAVWALAVAIFPNALQSFLDWIFSIHFLVPIWKLTAFNFIDATLLVMMTFIAGYIIGFGFACVHNTIHKKK